jgi:hypothetical protein
MSHAEPQELPYEAEIAHLTRELNEAREEVAKLEGAREKATELEARLRWWQQGRDLFGSGSNGGTAPAGESKPTLAKAILHVMHEGDRTEWPTGTIMEALESRGWMPNGTTAEHAVRTKLAKLARGEDAVLQRVRHGTYALREAVSAEGS